jgi:two-component system, NarL family, sensor histidine kinase DesK
MVLTLAPPPGRILTTGVRTVSEVVVRVEPRERSGGLIRLAVPAALVYSAVFSLVQLGVVVGYPDGPDDARGAVAATACYLPLHLHHVACAVRGRRPPAGRWTLVAMTAVVVAATPSVGSSWLPVFCFVAVSALLVLPWPWSLVAVAALIAAQVPLAMALDTSVDAAPSYYAFVVWWRATALFVPIWLLGAARQLEVARRALAEEAVVLERLRIDDELRRTVGAALVAVAARGRRAVAAGDGSDELAEEASALVDDSRRALASARRLVNGYRRPSLAAELTTAASLLTAAGVATRVELPAGGLPDAPADDDVREALRAAVSARLHDGGAGAYVVRAVDDGARVRVVVEADRAAVAGSEIS